MAFSNELHRLSKCIDNDGGGTLDVAKSDQIIVIG